MVHTLVVMGVVEGGEVEAGVEAAGEEEVVTGATIIVMVVTVMVVTVMMVIVTNKTEQTTVEDVEVTVVIEVTVAHGEIIRINHR